MKRPYTLRVSAIALSLSLVLGSGVLATDVPPGGFGGNVPPTASRRRLHDLLYR